MENQVHSNNLINVIERQRQRFHSAFELAPIATFIMSDQGIVMDLNDQAEKMLESPKSTVIGMYFVDFTHPKDKIESLQVANRAKSTGIPQKMLKTYITAKRKLIDSETTVNYVEKNGDSYFITQSADITEKQAVKAKVMETLNGIREISNR